jgi:hypothetical protein
MAWDNTNLCIKGAKVRAALVE